MYYWGHAISEDLCALVLVVGDWGRKVLVDGPQNRETALPRSPGQMSVA